MRAGKFNVGIRPDMRTRRQIQSGRRFWRPDMGTSLDNETAAGCAPPTPAISPPQQACRIFSRSGTVDVSFYTGTWPAVFRELQDLTILKRSCLEGLADNERDMNLIHANGCSTVS